MGQSVIKRLSYNHLCFICNYVSAIVSVSCSGWISGKLAFSAVVFVLHLQQKQRCDQFQVRPTVFYRITYLFQTWTIAVVTRVKMEALALMASTSTDASALLRTRVRTVKVAVLVFLVGFYVLRHAWPNPRSRMAEHGNVDTHTCKWCTIKCFRGPDTQESFFVVYTRNVGVNVFFYLKLNVIRCKEPILVIYVTCEVTVLPTHASIRILFVWENHRILLIPSSLKYPWAFTISKQLLLFFDLTK